MSDGRRAVGLPADRVERFLAELGEAVLAIRDEHAAARERADHVEKELEAWFAQDVARLDRLLAADKLLLNLRCRADREAACRLSDALRDMTAWWAHSALVAVAAAARGQQPDPIMLAAGNPVALMDEKELRQLPPINAHDRSLADLTLFLAGGPIPSGAPGGAAIDETTRGYLASMGLKARAGPGGEPCLAEDGQAEARRCRLWGQTWKRHRMPELLNATELLTALGDRQLPADTAQAIRTAAEKTDRLLAAFQRWDELDARIRDETGIDAATEHAIGVEIDALWDTELTNADDTLSAFARTLSDHLPAIRAATGATRPDPDPGQAP